MSNIYIINAHQPYCVSPGELNATMVNRAKSVLCDSGHIVRTVDMHVIYDVDKELHNHQWADVIIVQSPVNWMGVPWSFKKYMDEVYSAGMDGRLAYHDGRRSHAPLDNYGGGGTQGNTKYMFSLTFNAPENAFDNQIEYLFQGKTVDDLFFPLHMTYRFFAMKPLPTFACFDVLKNPTIEHDLMRFEKHLLTHI